MLTLTGKEIKDLAEAVGLVIKPLDYEDELETEMTIIDCPASGVLDDDGKATHFQHVAYYSEYPEEGMCPLGDEVTANAATKAEHETCAKKLPDVLFDGYAVMQALGMRQQARTSPENVSDVLDAVVRLMRSNAKLCGERSESAAMISSASLSPCHQNRLLTRRRT